MLKQIAIISSLLLYSSAAYAEQKYDVGATSRIYTVNTEYQAAPSPAYIPESAEVAPDYITKSGREIDYNSVKVIMRDIERKPPGQS